MVTRDLRAQGRGLRRSSSRAQRRSRPAPGPAPRRPSPRPPPSPRPWPRPGPAPSHVTAGCFKLSGYQARGCCSARRSSARSCSSARRSSSARRQHDVRGAHRLAARNGRDPGHRRPGRREWAGLQTRLPAAEPAGASLGSPRERLPAAGGRAGPPRFLLGDRSRRRRAGTGGLRVGAAKARGQSGAQARDSCCGARPAPAYPGGPRHPTAVKGGDSAPRDL